jgi:recombination protein RecA
MFGSPETTTGGNALKYYASIRIDVRRSATIKDGEEATGNRTKVKIVKNKVAPPFKTAEFDILYGKGISKAGEVLDLGVELNVIQKSGSWFSYNGEKLGQGRDSVRTLIEDNPELLQEIEHKIKDKLSNGEKEPVSTPSKIQKG